MEEDFLKSNTDCVYFLASPFTCKKGVECEYRHSDVARLNPRDCWYWLSGNCLNPVCAFRHPPLDVHNEASTETASLNTSLSSTKRTVPCYFYYNGFCSKGHKCPFLHEPSQSFGRDPKISNNTPVILSDSNKTPKGVDADHIPTKDPSVPSKTTMAPSSSLHNEQEFIKSNSNEKIYIPQCENIPTFQEGQTKSEDEPSLDSDQSSEDLTDGQIVRDEWESSPGFDVLVNGKTEYDSIHEDDPEYLHDLDGNDHGFTHQTEYDERGFFDNNDLYEPSKNEPRPDLGEYSLRQTCYKNPRHVSRKRKSTCLESRVGARHDVDLRDYLRKRRMIHRTFDSSHDLVNVRDQYKEERYHRYGSTQLEHRKLASKVERNESRLSKRRNSLYDLEHQGRYRSGFRQYSGRKSRKYLTDRKSNSKREKHTQESTAYSKPENGLVDFEGPKPLSEILKVKKNMVSSSN